MTECPKCHAQLLPNSIYCEMCGCELAKANTEAALSRKALEVEPMASEVQLQSAALPLRDAASAARVSQAEFSPQLTLPTGNGKAALPTAPSQVLQTNLLKRNASQDSSVGKVGNFASELLNKCKEIFTSGSSLLRSFNGSDKGQPTQYHAPVQPESSNKALWNKILAALLGVGVLGLCIFMIAKKLATSSLSIFTKQK